MTREEKIKAIYKEMANKDLSFGCKVKFSKWIYTIINKENVWSLNSYVTENWAIHNTIVIEDRVNSRCYLIEEIIWHPVMIWDVLDYFKEERFYCSRCKKIVDWRDVSDHNCWGEYYCNICNNDSLVNIEDDIVFYWGEKRKPIDKQSERCIDFIYSLIAK